MVNICGINLWCFHKIIVITKHTQAYIPNVANILVTFHSNIMFHHESSIQNLCRTVVFYLTYTGAF